MYGELVILTKRLHKVLDHHTVPACVGGFVGRGGDGVAGSGVGGLGVWNEQLPGVKLIASIAISPW